MSNDPNITIPETPDDAPEFPDVDTEIHRPLPEGTIILPRPAEIRRSERG
jgi:hypothetical protein